MERNARGLMSALWMAAVLFAGLALPGRTVLAQTQPAPDINNKRVTLNLENADLRYALQLLFKSAGVNYTLDQAVQGTVTVSLTDVPFRTALESVLRSTSTTAPLTYRVEDGVYIITPKVEEAANAAPAETTEEKTTPKSRAMKIPINFVDAPLLAAVFGGSAIHLGRTMNMMGGGGMGGFGGGMGGGFGGMGGGMGGMGGGMGGFGGGMGGFGGGMGGGGFGGGGFGGGGLGGGGFGGGGFGGGGFGGGGFGGGRGGR